MQMQMKMKNTKKNSLRKNKTRKSRVSIAQSASSFQSVASGFPSVASGFEKNITKVFLEMIIMIKLWHWKTFSYATHKATDQLYGRLNDSMDKFIEVLLGKTNIRIDLTKEKSLPLFDFTSVNAFKNKINWFKGYLVDLDTHPFMKKMSNSDLYNIRDEILANVNQFLYLLTFR